MRALLVLAVLLIIPMLVASMVYATTEDAQSTPNRFLAFGLSMGASLLLGAIKKKTLPKQGMRTAIPATNSVLTGGTAQIVTSDPYSALAAVGGSLAMSGFYSVFKRIKTGRW